MLDGVKAGLKLMNYLIFVRKSYKPNSRPLVHFLHFGKVVVGGGGWVLKADFSVKL